MSKDMADAEQVAQEVFGYDELRPGQAQAVAALLAGHDVLLVMPTGSGKSAAYQVPALLAEGPTVVVSPLIALQQDQMQGLAGRGESAQAVTISSAVPAAGQARAWAAMAAGEAEFLFLTPEQLAVPAVLERVRGLHPSLIAVDEAHCVSSWGHDFRPDYLRLGEFIDALGHPRVIALTATAAPGVREDIVSQLRLRDAEVIVRGFARPNIDLAVVRVMSPTEQHDAVLARVTGSATPAILYVATRRETTDYAQALSASGVRAVGYHGGMKPADRQAAMDAFMSDQVPVIVATNAFGMGVDKPNVRTIVHARVPDSPDSYYQEVGRAGRDGRPAGAVLFYRPEDLGLRRFQTAGVPDPAEVVAVVRSLADAGHPPARRGRGARGPDRRALAEATGLGPRKLGRILNLLAEAGWPEAAAEAAIERAQAQRRRELSRVEMMRAYCETRTCRRRFLLAYFGEEAPASCGNCDACRAGTATERLDPAAEPFAIQSRVHHDEFGDGVVLSYGDDPQTVTVLFEDAGYRTLALDVVRTDRLLRPVRA